MRKILVVLAACAGLLAGPAVAGPDGGTVERVRAAGLVRCGVTTSGAGLAMLDTQGRWQGFFVDFCRAVAAAVTGSADNVDFLETSTASRFQALRDGKVDLVADGSTVTLHRLATQGIAFPAVYMFDGQGFMAHRSLGAGRLAEVGAASVCVIEETTTHQNLAGWIAATGAKLTVRTVSTTEGALSAFFNHHCDLLTNDRISLFAQRLQNAPNPADYVVFPEVISKEPVSPTVKAGDRVWERLVAWVLHALVLAEEKGITATRAAFPALGEGADPEARRLLGLTPGLGEGFGLDDLWARRAIAQVGNYGELYERHLGAGSRLNIERGPNALWTRGGLLYAPPLGG
ncbi:amino acid ABC transporter substrate-binding protein [Azospirillum sp.]|uniref:amino acid ABC transporter substrate-binding protein n=1 Tax=Azospirillum sp. TaxID=34012 RepID=UPI003D71EF82